MNDGGLPNFLIVGAVRAGTTSLHNYIGQHPDVFMSREKELNFFCFEGQEHPRFKARTLEEYMLHFPPGHNRPVRGESSPNYLQSASARTRIARQLPNARLLVSLRNPVERAYSHWVNHSRFGVFRSFEEALEKETMFVEHSRYLNPLKACRDLFRDRLKVVLFDDLQADPLQLVQDVFGFLGVDSAFEPDLSRQMNQGRVPLFPAINGAFLRLGFRLGAPKPLRLIYRSVRRLVERNPPPLPPQTSVRLHQLFREETLALQEFLDRDLSGWLAEEP